MGSETTTCGCCCCCCCDGPKSVDPQDVPFSSQMKRSCRDVVWLVLFVAVVCGLFIVGGFALKEGDTARFTHGTDMFGQMCGTAGSRLESHGNESESVEYDMTNATVLLWPTPLDLDVQICVNACPTETLDWADIALIFLPDSDFFARLGNRSMAMAKLICAYGVTPSRQAVLNGSCWAPYPSKAMFGRCVPSFDVNASEVIDAVLGAFFGNASQTALDESSEFGDNETTSSMSSNAFEDDDVDILALAEEMIASLNAREVFTRVISDVASSWQIILILGAASFVVGFMWLLLLRFVAGLIIWSVILGAMIGMLGLTAYVWVLSRQALHALPATETLRLADDVIMAEFLSYAVNALLIVDTLMLFALFLFRRRIKLAVAIVKEATIAVRKLPSLVTTVPLFTFLALAIVMGYGVLVLLFLATAGMKPELDTSQVFDVYLPNYTLQYLSIFHCIAILWVLSFVVAMARLTISGSIAAWYWKAHNDPGACASAWSFWRALRYHAGSAALGSLLITLVRTLRAILDYADARRKKKQSKLPQGTPLGAAFCCAQCCLCCFERCLKYLTNNAYIVVAITGKSLCVSGLKAVETMAKNPIRTTMTNLIAGFFFILTKVAIASITTFIAALVLASRDELKYWYIPCAFVFAISFVVASIFTVIYEMAVRVILFSFCFDESILGEAHDLRLLEYMCRDKRKSHEAEIQEQGDTAAAGSSSAEQREMEMEDK